MEGQSGLSELSVISWVSTIEGCLLSGVPLYEPKVEWVAMLPRTHYHTIIRYLHSFPSFGAGLGLETGLIDSEQFNCVVFRH